MTPDMLKGLIDWALSSSELVGQELKAFQESKRPKGVSDVILDRVIANTAAPARPPEAQISRDSDASWSVEGLDRVFLTRADAEIAADVMAAVRETEDIEGRSSQ